MKRSEIQVGKVYTNNCRGFREVTAEGPEFTVLVRQEDTDCIEYRGWHSGQNGLKVCHTKACYQTSTTLFRMTCARFADWAKRIATPEEAAACREVK